MRKRKKATSAKSFEFRPSEAQTYLNLLDKRAATFSFSWYPEKGTSAPLRPEVATITTSYLSARFDDELAMLLAGFNLSQRAIYVCMNRLGRQNGSPDRTDANVAEVRAIFADFDYGLPEAQFPISPTALVQTSIDHKSGQARYQAFWRCKGVQLDEFDAVERRLVRDWKADPASVNRSRIQRLPGYWHQKHGVPFLVEIIEANDITYSRDQIMAAFPPVKSAVPAVALPGKLTISQRATQQVRAPVSMPGTDSDGRQVTSKKPVPFSPDLARELLSFIPAKSYEREYWPVIAAMKRWAGQDNAEAREIAREWAQSEPASFDPTEFEARWSRPDEERERQFTAGTLFHLARENGWKGRRHPGIDDQLPQWMQKFMGGGTKQ